MITAGVKEKVNAIFPYFFFLDFTAHTRTQLLCLFFSYRIQQRVEFVFLQ
jgi:hypothetical protein